MSTTATLAQHDSEAGKPYWRVYEDLFETGVVYLELRGVSIELRMQEQGSADVVLRLPVETATQLGLHTTVPPEQWKRACDKK